MAIDQADFAERVVHMATFRRVYPEYMAAVAKIRSGIDNATNQNGIGPFGLEQGQWNAAVNDPALAPSGFQTTDINRWGMQVPVFAFMTGKTQAALAQRLGREFTFVELYNEQWPNTQVGIAELVAALLAIEPMITTALHNAEMEADVVTDPTTTVASGAGAGPLIGADWQKFCDVLGERESTNNYTSVNQFGFAGRWQFGAGALIDGGYVKKGTGGDGAPSSASAWTGKDGISSRQDWLASKPVQDAAIIVYTASHYKSLVNMNGLTSNSPLPRVAGLLAAAHLKGVGGAMKLVDGTVTSDANGATTKEYYRLLSQAFNGTGDIASD